MQAKPEKCEDGRSRYISPEFWRWTARILRGLKKEQRRQGYWVQYKIYLQGSLLEDAHCKSAFNLTFRGAKIVKTVRNNKTCSWSFQSMNYCDPTFSMEWSGIRERFLKTLFIPSFVQEI